VKSKFFLWNNKLKVWGIVIVINEGQINEPMDEIVKLGVWIFGNKLFSFNRKAK
jgi:hypothetical protein